MTSRKRLGSVLSPLLNVRLQLEKRFKACELTPKPGFSSYYLSCKGSQSQTKFISDCLHVHADSGIFTNNLIKNFFKLNVYYFSLLFKVISSAIIAVEAVIFYKVLIFEKFHPHSI